MSLPVTGTGIGQRRNMHRSRSVHAHLSIRMRLYYTPKTIKFQVFLGKYTIFVNYAHFYVNIVMLTTQLYIKSCFAIFDYLTRYRALFIMVALNVVFAIFLALCKIGVILSYPYLKFVQLNEIPFSSCVFRDFFLLLSVR